MGSPTSQKCVNCNATCRAEDLYCLHCGYILPQAFDGPSDETRSLESQQNRAVDLQWGTGYFHHRAKLFLHMAGTDIVIPMPIHRASVVVGRSSDGVEADVDLTRFDAVALGVSRRHIRVDRLRDALQVTDLESANGTFLNRDRLAPGVPHTLRNRAVLQLGRMILRVQFA
jgi:hypothetical protein